MDTELLNCRRMTTGLLFPTRQMQQTEMNRLYVSVTENYPYQTLQHLPDGVRMANTENDLILQGGQPPNPGRMQVNENNIFHFEPAKEKALHLFSIVSNSLSLQQFLTFGVKLTAFLPVEGASAAEVIENSAFGGFRSMLDDLGPGRKGSGFRVVIHNNGAHDLRIEPFFSDLSQVFVELDVQHNEPFNDLSPLAARMDSAYRFLNEDVRGLLARMG